MAESLGQAQDDPGPENISLTARLGRHDALEFALLFRGDLDRNGGRHHPYYATNCLFMQSYLRDITLGRSRVGPTYRLAIVEPGVTVKRLGGECWYGFGVDVPKVLLSESWLKAVHGHLVVFVFAVQTTEESTSF